MGYSQPILDVAERVNNWGRWGDADRRGTVNFITDEVVRNAAASVRSGRRFSLAFPLQADGLQIGFIPGRDNPELSVHMINENLSGDPDMFCTSDDAVKMGLQAATHWDGLSHASWRGRLYNGVSADTITAAGASTLGIEHIGALTSRGVLLDIARLHGVDTLTPGHAIGADDLRAAEQRQGVTVRPGDIVLVRTGMMADALAGNVPGIYGGMTPEGEFASAGIAFTAAAFFHERDVAAVATDNVTFEVYPSHPDTPGEQMAVHCIHLVEMGLTQGQNFVLEELAADCEADGQWDFLLEASPLPFVAGCGSPVHPIAVK